MYSLCREISHKKIRSTMWFKIILGAFCFCFFCTKANHQLLSTPKTVLTHCIPLETSVGDLRPRWAGNRGFRCGYLLSIKRQSLTGLGKTEKWRASVRAREKIPTRERKIQIPCGYLGKWRNLCRLPERNPDSVP